MTSCDREEQGWRVRGGGGRGGVGKSFHGH